MPACSSWLPRVSPALCHSSSRHRGSVAATAAAEEASAGRAAESCARIDAAAVLISHKALLRHRPVEARKRAFCGCYKQLFVQVTLCEDYFNI